MAKETRTQRRARREAREASSVGAPPTGPPGGTPRASGSPEPAPKGPAQPAHAPAPGESHHRGAPRVIRFIRESSQELKKVEWPTQNQVVTGTTVVLIACIIVGAFLYLNDEVWKRVVEHIVLR